MADQIDVRDIIDRVEHLEALHEPGPIDLDLDDQETSQDDLFAELATLETLLEELKGNGGDHQWRGDWYPGTLIRDTYFEEYAQELAEDCDLINDSATWPNNCIDWELAAHELQYSTVEYDGVTYWYR